MGKRPEVTRSGLLSESFGDRPYTVRLREEKEPGSNVILDYAQDGRRRKVTLGYPVRQKAGKAWKWDDAALERARSAALDRSAALRLDRLREEVKPTELTVEQAFALFNDEVRGALPPSPSLRSGHLRAAKVWTHWLGAATPWNRIIRSNVTAAMRHYAERRNPRTGEPMIPTGIRYVEILRVCYNWLYEQAGFEDLRDPTRGFDWAGWKKKHRPQRPRYSDEETKALLRVRHDVDPRFALFLALVDDSASRGKAVRTLWRSMVNPQLDQPPTEQHAPHGWVVFPPLKGQDPVLHFLTAFERRELEVAFGGYLRELEALWESEHKDYPLFPAVRKESLTGGRAVRPEQVRAYQAVSPVGPADWLLDAERAAKVQHVDGRLYHGFRRRASDYLLEATDLKTLTVAAGWKSERTPEQIYVEKHRHPSRARAREAMEDKRREGPETVGPPVGNGKKGRNRGL